MDRGIKRNNGVFEAEVRLWACYIAVPLYLCGFLVLGAAFQNKLSVGAVVMGWGIAEVAIMINTVAICACTFQDLLLLVTDRIASQTRTAMIVSQGTREKSQLSSILPASSAASVLHISKCHGLQNMVLYKPLDARLRKTFLQFFISTYLFLTKFIL